jgi:hypothetical protein
MKKIFILLFLAIISLNLKGQYSYTPLSEQEIERIGRLLLQNKINSIFNNTYLTVGVVDLGPCENFLSYNPIEGVRLRVSGKTNANLSKRFSFEWLLAYGTSDKKFKYGASMGYNFAKKASSLYSFEAKTLSLSYYDNTYMPYLADYDKIQYSLSSWNNFILASQRTATLKFFYEFPTAISFTPALHYRNYYSRLHYNDKEITQLIHTPLKYLIAEANITYQPGRKDTRKTTKISLTYAYNFPLNNLERKYEELRLVAQRRFLLANNFSLDLRLSGGKIFGTTNPYLLLTPTMTNSLVSSVYGFNLLQYGRTTYHKQYLQTFAQFNLALKPSKITAFIYHKSLYGQYMPYHEVGIGLDNLFNTLGVEIIRSFSFEKETYPGMWGVRVRIK